MQSALDAAGIIRRGRVLRAANAAGFAGIIGAGGAMALGAFNGDIFTGGATVALGTYFAKKLHIFGSAYHSLKAMGIHKTNVLSEMGEKTPVAKQFVEKYGLYYNPQATWKKLSKNYGSFVMTHKGITFYPRTTKHGLLSALRGGKRFGNPRQTGLKRFFPLTFFY